jgi:hypothetical protein
VTTAERDNLVLAHEGLPGWMARRWCDAVSGYSMADLAQEARLVMLRAAERFSSSRRATATTFFRAAIEHHFCKLRAENALCYCLVSRYYGEMVIRVRRGESPESIVERSGRFVSDRKPVMAATKRAALLFCLRRDSVSRRRSLKWLKLEKSCA